MYVVVTLFNGKPPSVYYEKLHALGITGHRRVKVVTSLSLAIAIRQLAIQHGGGAFVFPTAAAITGDTLPKHQAYNPGISDRWVITCYECARSHQSMMGPSNRQCPRCQGVATFVRPGILRPSIVPAKAHIIDQWIHSRFSTGWLTFPPSVSYVAGALELPQVEPEWASAVDRVIGLAEQLRLASMEELDAALCLEMFPALKLSYLERIDDPREMILTFIANARK